MSTELTPRPIVPDAAPFVLEVFGVRWDLHFYGVDPAVVERMSILWSRARVADPADGIPAEPLHVVRDITDARSIEQSDALDAKGVTDDPWANDVIIVGDRPEAIPYALSRGITLRSIARRRGQALMLHAVGVCAPDGRTLALVAPSGTGKTTAASVLGRALGYVTDETVVIEADGRVSPYPKPLSIISDPAATHDKHELSPDELGLLPHSTGEHRPTLSAVVIIRRDPDLAAPELEMISLLDAVLAVIPETSALPVLPNPLDWLCRAVTANGGPYRLTYAEIDRCVELLTPLTTAEGFPDAEQVTWEHLPGPVSPLASAESGGASSGSATDGPAGPAGPAAGTTAQTTTESTAETTGQTTADQELSWEDLVERCPWTDAVVADGEALLLQGAVPIRLSHLGATLWLYADRPTPISALHDRAVTQIGQHEQSDELVLDAARALVKAGVLQACSLQ